MQLLRRRYKAKTMSETLFSCLYGSHLFGTNTPLSDRDEKHIVLPTLDSLLIGRAPKTVVQKTNTKENTRNTKDDVDVEIIPVQVFARDFTEGQTYALELAFAVEGTHAEQNATPAFKLFCAELRTQFLTSNLRAMMGYAVNQANLYSFKGERLNTLRAAQAALAAAQAASPDAQSLAEVSEHEAFAQLASASPKYFRRAQYDIGGGQQRGCFVLLEKTLPFTNTIIHTQSVLDALEKKYGTRANEASATNVDWKAFMHALRIVDQGIELLQTARISLPRPAPEIAYLLQVRRGEIAIEILRESLHEKLDVLKELETYGALLQRDGVRKARFELWLTQWMRTFYRL
jgi:RNA repair pathway DNA polymerase beta family